jgi:hypothetical protein
MSTTSQSEFDPLPGEDLVAYLDGELPPDACRRVEEQLAANPAYRQQLSGLDQTWEALDALPATNVDDQFTRTTIEMVTVAAEREVAQQADEATAANRRLIWRWAAAGIAAAAIGFAATRLLLPDANEALLANLPVIYQYDVLSQIDSVDFLRKLSRAVPLERLAGDLASIDRELAVLQSGSADSLAERRQWVVDLPPDQKATLASQAERFNRLADKKNLAEQQRLHELDGEIRADEKSAELQRTLLAYSHWLAKRSPGEQEELRLLTADERIELIKELVEQDERRAAFDLSAAEREKLQKEVFAIYEDRKEAFDRAMRRRERDDRGERDNRPRFEGPPWQQASAVMFWQLFMIDDKDGDTSDRLIAQLSPEKQEQWERLPERGRGNRRREQLWRWVREAIQPKWGPEGLEEFFTEKLDNDQRAWLLSLPREKMQMQLEQLYMADQFGLRGPDGWPGGPGPRGGMPEMERPFGPPPGGPGPGRPDRRPEGRRGPPPREGRVPPPPPDRPSPDERPGKAN